MAIDGEDVVMFLIGEVSGLSVVILGVGEGLVISGFPCLLLSSWFHMVQSERIWAFSSQFSHSWGGTYSCRWFYHFHRQVAHWTHTTSYRVYQRTTPVRAAQAGQWKLSFDIQQPCLRRRISNKTHCPKASFYILVQGGRTHDVSNAARGWWKCPFLEFDV